MSLHTLKSLLFSLFLTCMLSACGSSKEDSDNNKFDPSLTFASNVEVNEGEAITIAFNLDSSTLHEVSFDYKIIENSAKNGIDFQAVSGSLIIKSGKESATIEISTIDNLTALPNANFQILISNVKGANIENKLIEVIITDNEPELSFDHSYSVAEGQVAQVTLTLSKVVEHRVEVYYQTSEQEVTDANSEDEKTIKHIAKADKDFTLLDEVAYFEPGETTTQISLSTLFNYTTHDDLYFNFKVTKAIGASLALEQSLIEITDNEPLLSFQNRFFVEEGKNVSIEFELPEDADHEITLKYETSEGTAIAGEDYQHSSGVISIKNTYGYDSKVLYRTKLYLSTIAQDSVQPDREFYFNIIDINGAKSNSKQATIAISDAVENINFGFNKSQTMASYQAGNIAIEVNKSKASTEVLTVPFNLSGTAVNGIDYTIIEDDNNSLNTVTFASEETTAYINLQVIDNGLPRSSSNIRFNLSAIGLVELNDNNQHDIILVGALALNDTGALTGDDSKHGRDNDGTLNDSHDGAAGFSFTKISDQGNKLADDARTYSCVADNVTGLVYEAKQQTPEKAHTYNARLSNAELTLLINTKGKNIEFLTYQDIYDVFPSPDNDGHDFEQITGKKFDAMLDSEKSEFAFTVLTELTKKGLAFLLTDSKRQAGNTLEYPFNIFLEIQHINWRSSDHNYYWFNENTNSNGGRNGSEGKLANTKLPISRFCGFPHEEATNYVDDINGCNSSDYVKVMNDLAVCGFTDWRLPQIEELRSIVNYELNASRWDGAFLSFANESGNYISDSPSVSNDATVWCVAGNTGEVKLCHKQEPNYIRAVRGNNNE